MPKSLPSQSLTFEKARSIRIETAALLTVAREIFGKEAPYFDLKTLPGESLTDYHAHVQIKRALFQQNLSI